MFSNLYLAQRLGAPIFWGDPRSDGAARVHEQFAHGVDVPHFLEGGGLGAEVGNQDVTVAPVVEPLELNNVCEI